MVDRNSVARLLVVALMVVLIGASSTSAQSYWMKQDTRDNITFEFLKAKFDGDPDFGVLTSNWFISGRFQAGSTVYFVWEAPVSYLKRNENEFRNQVTQTQIGNPYIGIESRTGAPDKSSGLLGRLGVRPPVASDEKLYAAQVGAMTTYDRLEAFMPKVWSFCGGLGYFQNSNDGMNVRFNAELVVLKPTEDGEDTETISDYNAAAWWTRNKLSIGAGFAGRWILSDEGADFGEASIHQLGFMADHDFGDVSVGLRLRLPVDEDLRNFLDIVYGFNFVYYVR